MCKCACIACAHVFDIKNLSILSHAFIFPSVDEESSLQWKASRARLKLRCVYQGFVVQPPLNLPVYLLEFAKLLWDAAASKCKEPARESRDAEAWGPASAENNLIPMDHRNAKKYQEKPIHAKRLIQDRIHRRYMNWADKHKDS